MAPKRTVDETLLQPRDVVKVEIDDPGFAVLLSCGHTVWCAVMPVTQIHSGECLYQCAEQCREVHASQRRPE